MNDTVSAFDPDSFLDTEVESANSTVIIPVPEYDAVPGMVKPGSIKVNVIHNQEKGVTSYIMNMDWIIDDEKAREITGRNEPTCRQSLFLELDSNGKISTEEGKNVALGRLREALGMNEGSFVPRSLEGRVAKLRIRHKSVEINGIDTSVAEVKGVLSMNAE